MTTWMIFLLAFACYTFIGLCLAIGFGFMVSRCSTDINPKDFK